MRRKIQYLKIGLVIGYVTAFLYLFITALLFSVSNSFYWRTLIFGAISLYNSLYTSYLLQERRKKKDVKKRLLVNLVLSFVSPFTLLFYLLSYFHKGEDKYLEVLNSDYKEVIKEKKEKPWYKKANFLIASISFVGIFLASFIAQVGETSGYSVETNDFKLTKARTEEFNAGEVNALNGKNFVIESEKNSYAVTEYKPKSASKNNPLPVVFVRPGFTRTKATRSQYAIELSRRGAVVFTIDPGCQGGTSAAGYDENGERISSTVGSNGLDYLVQYVYNNTEKYSYIDRENFGAVGHSAGGGNVCSVAENYSGPSFEDSIIKSVYISGYIKVSAANRFKNLRCNAALSYAYYDEGAFRYQGSTSAFEVVAKRFVNEINGQNLGYDKCIIDQEYGSRDEGSYRVVHREKINHCFERYDPASISNTINFFRRTLNRKTSVKDSSQTWFVKEGFNGVALVFAFLFTFSLMAFLVDVVPFFKSFRMKAAERKEYEAEQKVIYGGRSPLILSKPNQKIKKKDKSYFAKASFWTILVGTAIIACLDYIPLARWSRDLFPDAASNTYTYFFPARRRNAVRLWAVVNGLIGFVLIFAVKAIENLYFKKSGKSDEISNYRFKARAINWKDLLKSIGFAFFLFVLFYAVDELVHLCFHQDFRFRLISAAPLEPRYIVTWLIYFLPFFIFYLSNSVRVNLSMANEGWSEWKVYLLSAIGNSIGLVFILVINYYVYFKTGTVFYGYYSPKDTSEMWLYINRVFALIPRMFLLPILNRFCFKKTGNVYFGARVTCRIFIRMSLSASVSYIPL